MSSSLPHKLLRPRFWHSRELVRRAFKQEGTTIRALARFHKTNTRVIEDCLRMALNRNSVYRRQR